MNEDNDQLILIVTASYKGAVGFGEIFDCQIKRVLVGTMDEPRIRLSILASDKDKLMFISAHLHPAEIEIGFTVNRKGEPYSLSPISGFVDKSKTSWWIEFIRESKE
jgi:hypothetical protein